jgi:molybdate transport system substrate-binding protein
MRLVLLAVGALGMTSGCGPAEAGREQLGVFAASSLTEAFQEMEALFERAHPGTDAVVTFAGSQVLRIQIEEGAPADVFASADAEHVEALVDAGIVREARVFAHNRLVLIVPLDNPAGIEAFGDLPRARRLVLGTPDVPAGRYAREALTRAEAHVRPGFRDAVLARLVSEEANVRLARAKVELGEADAAIVYRTDALGSDRVRAIAIPDDVNVEAEYRMGVVDRPGGSELSEAWIELVLSDEGRAVLERHGFTAG